MHPENKVLDAIDRLVEESLHKPKDDYDAPYTEVCELCGYEWHGATNGIGCPGAYATEQQAATWYETLGARQDLARVDDDGQLWLAGMVCMIDENGIGLAFLVMPDMPHQGLCQEIEQQWHDGGHRDTPENGVFAP